MIITRFNLACTVALAALGSGCASWVEEDRRAQAMAAQHHWNKLLEQHNTQPAASGPKWQIPNQQAQTYLDYLRQIMEQDVDALLEGSGPGISDCELDEVSKSYVMHQKPPEAVARDRQEGAKHGHWEALSESVTLLSGHCEDGKLDGPFAAIYTDNSRFSSQYVNGETRRLGRIDGHFSNGVLDGEVRVIIRDRSNTSGSWRDTYYLTMGVYESDQPVGTQVTLAENFGGQSIFVRQALEQGRSLNNTWMNDQPNTRYYMLDGAIDGWMEFASPVLRDSPNCYQAGQQLSTTSYCQLIAAELGQLAPVAPRDGYARLPELGLSEVAVSLPAVDSTASTESGTVSTGSTIGVAGNGAWRVPQVGYYGWLNVPSDRALAKTKVSDYLPRLQAALQGDVTAKLVPGTPLECELDSDKKSYLLFHLTANEKQILRERQKQFGYLYEDSPADIILTSGDCSSGQLEGEFTAYYLYQHHLLVTGMNANFDMYGRVEGRFTNGRLDGEFNRTWLKEAKSQSFLGTEVGMSLASFDNGERLDEEVHLVAIPGSRSTRLVLINTRADGRERVETWNDGKPQMTFLVRQGVNDGYIKYFDPVLRNLSNCYRDGVEINDNSYCEELGL